MPNTWTERSKNGLLENMIIPHGKEPFCSGFGQHAREWNIRELPSLRVKVAPARFRVPDVTVLDRDQPIEQIITHPPVAVFEYCPRKIR